MGFLPVGFAAPGTDNRTALRRVFRISGAVRETRRAHRCGGADGAVTVTVHLHVAEILVDAGHAVVPLGTPRIFVDVYAGSAQTRLLAAGNTGIAERVRHGGASIIEVVYGVPAKRRTDPRTTVAAIGERIISELGGRTGCFNLGYGQSH